MKNTIIKLFAVIILGTCVFGVAAVSNELYPYPATLSTTDATVTTLATLTTNSTIDYELRFTVHGTTTDGVSKVFYSRLYRCKNIGGTVTTLTFEAIGTDYEDAALAGCDIVATISGANVLFQINGVAATNLNWHLKSSTTTWYPTTRYL